MHSDAIIAQALELGFVPVTDLTDEQLQRLTEESQQRLAQPREQQNKEIENAGGLGLQA